MYLKGSVTRIVSRLGLLLFILSTYPAWSYDLRIGTTLSLTGAYATFGRQALQGMQLAVEGVNEKGAIGGRKVALIVEDFGTLDLRRAITAARKMVDVDKVELLGSCLRA